MTTQTYAESCGEKPFDWNAFLARAKANSVTSDEWREATNLAGDWVTCACGNQCAVIPRNKSNQPFDALLNSKGYRFYRFIANRDVDGAIKCLAEIEHRAAQLIHAIETGTEAP